MGVDIPEGAMDQAKPMMDMIDAMGQQMFNEIIDENGDGAASLEEIEMVSYFKLTIMVFVCRFKYGAKVRH